MSSNRFHLAIEAGDLSTTVAWYQEVLGCELDMAEEGKWQDIDFWGNELTQHASEPRVAKSSDRHRHSVDMGAVCVPHFGVHLTMEDYLKVRASVQAANGFLDDPYVRFEGTDYQQETFFVEDPNFNVLEIKHMTTDMKK
ncbi:MAG: VOC family protein [Acidiferrobacterales bacterium]|nr:VOC family protein [Acidiferrobacterales bacterium]